MTQSSISKAVVGCSASLLGLFALAGQVVGQTCVSPPSGIVSWWPGDGNANDIRDGNNGMIGGGATFAPGLVSQAFQFNGQPGAVDAGNATNLQVSSGDFTVEAWVYYNSLFNTNSINCGGVGCDMSIVDKMLDFNLAQANADGWRFMKQAGNYFLFCFGGAPTNPINFCGSGPVNAGHSVVTAIGSVFANTWYHVAAVKSSSTISIYVNGVLGGQSTLGPFTDTNSVDLLIGSNRGDQPGGAAFTNVLIDEVTLYSRALSQSEIQGIYSAGSAGKCKFTPVNIAIKPPALCQRSI
jgi:hypothetical protein